MSSLSVEQVLNSTLIQTVLLYVNNIPSVISKAAVLLSQTSYFEWLVDAFTHSLQFDEFQWTLLYSLTLIFVINIVLICAAWRVFGRNICERFMKPATSKAIDELKASVSRLKLPKEHTPRI